MTLEEIESLCLKLGIIIEKSISDYNQTLPVSAPNRDTHGVIINDYKDAEKLTKSTNGTLWHATWGFKNICFLPTKDLYDENHIQK